jgi:hypothetical protein
MTATKLLLCGYFPRCIKNETHVREAEGIVKAQVHGVMTYITPPPFFSFFFPYTSQHNFGIK